MVNVALSGWFWFLPSNNGFAGGSGGVILSGLIEIGLKQDTSLSGLEIDPRGSDSRRDMSGDFTTAVFGDIGSGESCFGDWTGDFDDKSGDFR